VFLEAEGEPEDGQAAVAWVIRNRMRLDGKTARAVILGADGRAYGDGRAFEVFSCWNDDYRARATARLAAVESPAWAWRAAAAGLFGLGADPSHGAYFYLNEARQAAARRNVAVLVR
jgi:spore germination cell wall hydrolase CwlJ-like protein